MKQRELYHGSSHVIERPQLGMGNPKNDYGLGFYCTPSAEMAGEWACGDEVDGFINRYRIDLTGLKELNLNDGSYTILHWLTVLVTHRTFRINGDIAPLAVAYLQEHFSVPVEEYDIVRGYRADDSYFAFASGFLSGSISLPRLQKAMTLGKLGEQVVPRTQKAYDHLSFVDARPVLAADYYPKKLARDQKARSDFFAMRDAGDVLREPRITDILREGWGPDDPRLMVRQDKGR